LARLIGFGIRDIVLFGNPWSLRDLCKSEIVAASSFVGQKFWKMHGLGNDYVLIDNRDGKIGEENTGKVAERLCNRRFSIGGDGLLILYDSSESDVKMRIFNADGSEAEMCGNGIRCFAKYCYENGVVDKTELKVETQAGMKDVWIKIEGGKVNSVTVDMGKPILESDRIPVLRKGKCIDEKLDVDGATFKITCLSVGNPHCVIFINDVKNFPVETVGPKIESHPLFPNRINVEFVQAERRNELKVRVWERGVGETLACGTGACAAVVAGNLLGKIDGVCTVHLLGGNLKIIYRDDRILMSGPAEKAFEGIVNI
jgi:diaminopimelate epimerase